MGNNQEREKEEVAEPIRLQSSEHLHHFPRTTEEKHKARPQDVYSKSESNSWIFVCDQPGQTINQALATTSFSIVKTNSRQQADPPPQTICNHEMYFRPRRTAVSKISFSWSTGSHLPCPHIFLHCLGFRGDRDDEQHAWIPTPPPPPQLGEMTKTRGQTWRL